MRTHTMSHTNPLTYAELDAKIQRETQRRKIETGRARLTSKSRRPAPRTFAPTVNMTQAEADEIMYGLVDKMVKKGNKATVQKRDSFTYVDFTG